MDHMHEEDILINRLNEKISTFIESIEQGTIIPYELSPELKIEIVHTYIEAILEGFSICHPSDIKSEKPLIVDRIHDIRKRFKEGIIDINKFWVEILTEARLFNEKNMTYADLHYLISTWDQGFDKLKKLYTQIDSFTRVSRSEKEILKDEISKRLQDMEYAIELGKDVGELL